MANKDHSLDEPIRKAAFSEFLDLGYQQASLRNIAKKAGITSGALYTRYSSKDELFCSLLTNLEDVIKSKMLPIYNIYLDAKYDPSSKLIEAIKHEEEIFLDVLFDHYDECVLYFTKSAGSSIEKKIKSLMETKTLSTIEYLNSIARVKVDLKGLEFIMQMQFDCYKMILEKGYSKDEAYIAMKNIMRFLEAGWNDLLSRMM